MKATCHDLECGRMGKGAPVKITVEINDNGVITRREFTADTPTETQEAIMEIGEYLFNNVLKAFK